MGKISKGKTGRGKRAAVWLLVSGLLFGLAGTAGCGQGETGGNAVEGGSMGGGTGGTNMGSQGETGGSSDVMGRYLEEMDDSLKEELNTGCKIVQMEDGSLVIMSTASGKWVSADYGRTWEWEEMEWFEKLSTSNWIMDIAVAKDGYMAVIYEPQEEGKEGGGKENEGDGEEGSGASAEGNEEDAEGSGVLAEGDEKDAEGSGEPAEGDEKDAEGSGEPAVEDKKDAKGNGATVDGNGEDADEGVDMQTMDFSIHPRYALITPEGTFTELEIPYKDPDYVNRFFFVEGGRLFGTALGGKVYEIDRETEAVEEVMECSGWVQYMTAKDGRLLMVNADGVSIMDMNTWETVEDKALDDFLSAWEDGFMHTVLGVQPLLLIPDENGILYLIFEKGIYRHVIGGNVVEQVADGALNSLGNPAYGISDGILLEDDVFLLLFANGELMRYTYDPDTPAVPEIQVRAYSLAENGQLRKVIASYQAKHPEVFIQYETGINENSAATREDALKKLNAEIAAGKGPDFFLLDDMPVDSYVEKGVLADLSPYLQEKGEEEYFTNVLNTFRTPEGIYVVPSQFWMALLVGKQDDIEKMGDLESIAGMMEAYREEKGEGMILGARGEEEMINKLLPACAPAWKDEEGKVDKAALAEFYTQVKRMWEVEKEGLNEEIREEYGQWIEDMRSSGETEEAIREAQFSISSRMLDYLTGEQEFVAGVIADSFSFDTMVSCFRIKGKTDSGFRAFCGQSEGVFVPDGLMGISSTSRYQDIAGELLEAMLEDGGWGGMPVNKEKCRENFRVNMTEDGGSYGAMGVASQNGSDYIYLDIYPASEEEIGLLVEAAAEGSSPYVRDSVLENAVCEAGVKVLLGDITAEEGAEEVIQKTAIYMSE